MFLFVLTFVGSILVLTDFKAKATTEPTSGFEMDGAQVGTDYPKGIRFVTQVSKDFYDGLEDPTFGTLVIPTEKLPSESTLITLETAEVENSVTGVWATLPETDEMGEYYSTLVGKETDSVFEGLAEKYWNTKLTARSCVYENDNPSTVQYADQITRTLAQVASISLAEYDNDGSLNEEALKNICDTVIGKNTTLAFAQGTSTTVNELTNFNLTLSNNKGLTAIWGSLNKSVATVENGVVTAIGYGTTDITATIGTKTATIQVAFAEPVIELAFANESVELYAPKTLSGNTNTINLSNLPALTATRNGVPVATNDITYNSASTDIATVDANGKITATGLDSTKVTATFEGFSGEITVYVRGVIASKADIDVLGNAAKNNNVLLMSDKYYVLTQDVDYNGTEIKPIAVNPIYAATDTLKYGRSDYGQHNADTWEQFKATLDDRGHVIKNAVIPSLIYVQTTEKVSVGCAVFGKNAGTIKNVGFINLQFQKVADVTNYDTSVGIELGDMRDTASFSGLVVQNLSTGTIENVYLDMTINQQTYVGADYRSCALVANNEGTIRNCVVAAEKDYTGCNTAGSWRGDFGAVGGKPNSGTMSNIFAVSTTLNFMAKNGTVPAGNALYTTVYGLLTA